MVLTSVSKSGASVFESSSRESFAMPSRASV